MKRIATYDILKGFGIILVILGHITRNADLGRCIYAFHMPLFFFISGVVYHQKKNFIWKQFKGLMIPYFIFSILSFLYWFLIELHFREKRDGTNVLDQLLNIVYPMNMQGGYEFNIVLWFLPCLFITSTIYHLCRSRICNKWLNVVLLLVSIIFTTMVKIKLPFFLYEMFYALPFYICGVIYSEVKLNSELFSPAKNKKILWFRIFWGILCMCGVFTYILLTSMNGNMQNTSYSQGYFIFFICAILLILSLLEMTTDIKSVKPLQWLGINSLCIMLVHEPLKRIIIKAYSIVISVDVESVRISLFHTFVLLIIVLVVSALITATINKYAKFLIGKF